MYSWNKQSKPDKFCFFLLKLKPNIQSFQIVFIENIKVRGFGFCVSITVLSVASFLSTKTFPIWMEDFGLPITLGIYAIICLVGTVFVMCAMTETKGQSIDDVK